VGGDNFMNDLLTIAGGENVLPDGSESYPAIDREQLIALKPEAVLNLLPGASPQSQQKAQAFWAAAPSVPAIQNGRVYYLTEDYLLWPGMNVGNVAERFAEKLHPESQSRPSTRNAASLNRKPEEPQRHRVTEACLTSDPAFQISQFNCWQDKEHRASTGPLCLCASVALQNPEAA
jgi:hypothetical protein